MSSSPIRLDALIRVSQRAGRQDKDLRSPDQQREKIMDSDVVKNGAEVYWHPAAIDSSGKTMDRKDIISVLERIRSGQTGGLIVAYTSRFSRARVDEALALKAAVEEAGGRLVVCDIGGIDIDSAAGELVFTNLLALARFQWREIAERFEMSRANAIKEGKSIGGEKFGYRFKDPIAKTDKRGNQVPGVVNSRLVVDEELRHILRELFERKADGATWLELSRWLDEVAPKPGGRVWARSTVVSIIRSRTYLGEVRSGGKHVNPKAHEPLISPVLWRQAQNEPGRKTPRGMYLLSGLVRCAGCGRCMRASSGGLKKPAVYVCVTPECKLRYSTVIVSKLDDEVVRQLSVRVGDLEVDPIANDAETDAARRDVAHRTTEVETLAAIIPRHPAAVAAHQAALTAAEEALGAAEDRLQSLLASQQPSDIDPSIWPSLKLEEVRELLRAGIDAVVVRRATGQGPASRIADRVRVLFRSEAPETLLARDPVTSWNHLWDDIPVPSRATA